MKKTTILSVLVLAITTVFVIGLARKKYVSNDTPTKKYLTSAEIKEATYQFKKARREKGWGKPDKPSKFVDFQNAIRTKSGESKPNYQPNYKLKELDKAQKRLVQLKSKQINLNWVERGPGNVSGRTRGLIIDPDDASNNTWFAGSVGGGVWKTTNAGESWINLTPDLPNLSTVCLAMAESNHNIIYAGTGEGFYNTDAIIGDGIFKSTDKGTTWTQLSSTAGKSDFNYINRIIVDKDDENILLAATNTSIQKSTDGGASWTKVYSNYRRVQQIVASPDNFNVQFATVNTEGIIKSTDGGNTWNTSLNDATGRIELAISPSNPERIYAVTENSDLYISDDAGKSWSSTTIKSGSTELFLSSQGWYNNAIAVSPDNPDIIFIGGVNLFKVQLIGTATTPSSYYSVSTTNVGSFMDFTNFGALYLGGGMEINTDKKNYTTIEVQFGPGKSQMAHRFTVPSTSTSGVPASQYTYQDYVEVPFEVWDIEKNRQLMVSFRDQDHNKIFNLTPLIDSLFTGREYIWINDVTYAQTPSTLIAKTAGHEYGKIAFWWPVLAANATWDANNLPQSKITISRSEVYLKELKSERITHWYGADKPYIHADIHNVQITENKRIIVGNDGGIAYSNDFGKTWKNPANGYNTTQFYGIDKHPTQNRYIGGMQDNGSWISPENPDNLSSWIEATGGDGFDAVWNSVNPGKIIASLYNNELYLSIDQGESWGNVMSRIEESGGTNAPFITQIGSSTAAPEDLYVVSASGVSISKNFGQSWQMISFSESSWAWAGNGFAEPSLADPNVVWVGSLMESGSNLQLSTNGGKTFHRVNNYEENMGMLSGIATHPQNSNIVYALFSYSASPKILRSIDQGNSWTDITGFELGESTNGFPDVAVYSLLVMPYDTNILWAGTEIGLFVSTNNGESWEYAQNGLPAVAIWEMKIRGNQVVVATHGRGLWTADLPELANSATAPILYATGTNSANQTLLQADISTTFDSVQVVLNNKVYNTLNNSEINAGKQVYSFDFGLEEGDYQIQLLAYYHANLLKSQTIKHLSVNYNDAQTEYTNTFDEASNDFIGNGFTICEFGALGSGMAIHTDHPYTNNSNLYYYLKTPIILEDPEAVSTGFAYRDIPMLEAGLLGEEYGSANFYDYFVAEASADGINWTALADGYDFKLVKVKAQALRKTVDSQPTQSMFTLHQLDLNQNFDANDTVLIRFRMFSDFSTTGWGCVIDDIVITQSPKVGVNNTSINTTLVYPNPCQNQLTVKFGDQFATAATTLTIYNVNGKKVMQRTTNNLSQLSLNTESLKPAIYILEIKSGEKTEVHRFEKVK